MSIRAQHPLGILAAAFAAALLAACNSGSDGGSTSSSSSTAAPSSTASTSTMATTSSVATESMTGTVTGFGSVIVDGVRFDDSMTVAQTEAEPGNPTSVRVRELRLGQTATVAFADDGVTKMASAITVEAEVTGNVDSVDVPGKKLVVAGQDVRVNTDATAGPVTVFDGFTDLAGVMVGTRVEVHGQPKTDTVSGKTFVQATRIEREVSGSPFVRVTGLVEALGPTSFRLGALTVTYGSGTRILPASATLAQGDRVVVWSDAAAAGGTMAAKVIRIKKVPGTGTVRLSGLVDCGTSACTTSFKVAGFQVDAASARFFGGSASNLANGVFVRVRGTVDPATSKLVAATVAFRTPGEPEIELRGVVSGFVPANPGPGATFSVRNVTVTTNASTRLRNCAAALQDGLAVEIEGTPGAGAVTAREVKCLPAMDQLTSEIRGPIGTVTTATSTITLTNFAGLQIVWSNATTFVNGTSANLGSGAFVEVEGRVNGTQLNATRIKFTQTPGAGELEVKGIVFGFTGTAFQIGPMTIQVGSAALPSGFADGKRVEVHFTTVAGVNTATRIELDN